MLVLSSGSGELSLLYALLATTAFFGALSVVLAVRLGLRKTNILGVWGVLTFTFKEAVRTRWLTVFAVVFFLVGVNLPGVVAFDLHLMPNGIRTFGEQLLVAFPLVPLLTLPMGAISIVDDRESGTMQYLLSNPITKFDFFFGKIVGLLLATSAVILLGFGGACLFDLVASSASLSELIILTLTAILLNAVMVALALIISEFSKRKATATGIAMFFWFLLTTVSGLDTLTYAVYWKDSATAAISLILLDPLETSRITAIEAAGVNQTISFGQSDYLAAHFLGGDLLVVAFGSILVWLVSLTLLGLYVFEHQDAS